MEEMSYSDIEDIEDRTVGTGFWLHIAPVLVLLMTGVCLFAVGFCYMMTAMQNVGTTSFTELINLWCREGVSVFDVPILGEVPRYLILFVSGVVTLIGGIIAAGSFYSSLDDIFDAQECLDSYKNEGYACIDGV